MTQNTVKLALDYGDTILFVGAHCDDIEIGCGGTAAKLVAAGRKVAFAIAADCGPEREKEAREAIVRLGLNPREDIFFSGVPDRHLQEHQEDLQEWLLRLRENLQPDSVFVHHPDNNPDHAAAFKLVIRCCNRETILQYFVPQQDTRRTAFLPTFTEDISDYIEKKLELCACHQSQADKPIYLAPDYLKATAYTFFVEANSVVGSNPRGYGEAFHIHIVHPREDKIAAAASKISSVSQSTGPAAVPVVEPALTHHSYSWSDLANASDRVGKYVFEEFHAEAVITFAGHSAIFANLVLVKSLPRSELLKLPVYLAMARDLQSSSVVQELVGYATVRGNGFLVFVPDALVHDKNRPKKIAIIDDAITTGEQIITVKNYLCDKLNYASTDIAVACFVCHEFMTLIPERRPDVWEFLTPTTAYRLPWGAPLWFPRPGQ